MSRAGVGVVFACEHENPGFFFELVRDLDGLDDVSHHSDRIVLEGNDAFRACTHTNAAAAATGELRQRIAFLVFVDGAEGTFLRAPLALGAALHEEFGIARISGPGMDRCTHRGEFNALDGFHGRPGRILNRTRNAHGTTNGPRRVDAGSPAFVRETNVVRIGKIVAKPREFRPLAILKVQNIGHPDGIVHPTGLCIAFLFLLPVFLAKRRGGNHPRCQHHKVQFTQEHFLAQKLVFGFDAQVLRVRVDLWVLGTDEYDPLLLRLPIEVLALPGSSHFLVDHKHVGFRVSLFDRNRLFQGCEAANGRTVGKVLGITLPGTLEESRVSHRIPIRRPAKRSVPGDFLELHVCDHVWSLHRIPTFCRVFPDRRASTPPPERSSRWRVPRPNRFVSRPP